MKRYWAERVWTGGEPASSVEVSVDDRGAISAVTNGVRPSDDAVILPGVLMPGMVNAHSHAFHRALRGRAHRGSGLDFWQWRDEMYRVADTLTPDRYEALATAVFAEMASTGITAVGEFHYLHHGPGGEPYADPNETSHALARAATVAGIRLVLFDTCYLVAGLDEAPLEGPQQRFSDRSVDGWAARHRDLQADYSTDVNVSVGAAIHSVRAVPAASVREMMAMGLDGPLHIHVSEQLAENEQCAATHGCSPTELLGELGAVGPDTTIVHGVHTSPADRDLLAGAHASVSVCPTTESDLGDGWAPTTAFAEAGIEISLGSDSHAVIDLLREAQQLEHNARAAQQRRGVHAGTDLLRMTAAAGAKALGFEAWGITVGAPADLVAIDEHSPRTSGTERLENLVMTAGAADVTDVVVGGRHVVAARRHTAVPDLAGLLDTSITDIWRSL